MLPLLSFILGLSFLGGLNLYLATFLASLAVRQGWVDAGLHPALAVLGHPAFMIVAFVLFLVEFIMDKIPWMDSLWDAVHTLIRPAGAVGLSVLLLQGTALSAPGIAVVATVAGLFALTTHLTKSGVRLLINASPEPFTNILASLAEDVLVVLLLLLLVNAPVTGMAASLALLAGSWIVLPRMFRLVKSSVYLLWKRFRHQVSAAGIHHGPLPAALTVNQETWLTSAAGPDAAPAAWALPCVSGKLRGLPGSGSNRFGTLVSPAAQPGTLVFLSRGWFRRRADRVSLAGATVRQENTFLSTNLVIHRADDGLHLVFRFTRAEAPLVARLVQDLNARLGLAAPVKPLPEAPVFPRGLEPGASSWSSPPPLEQRIS